MWSIFMDCNLSWDVVKTRIQQNSHMTYFNAIKQGNLWRGLLFCCAKFLNNGIVFYTFEGIMKKL